MLPTGRVGGCPFCSQTAKIRIVKERLFLVKLAEGTPRMNVLVIGNGGREHALAWKLAQSSRVKRVFVAPGNAGTAADAENVNLPVNDFKKLIRFARSEDVDLTVVGPEAPLADGIVDAFQGEGLRTFGPSKAAAQLEGSKVFCKDLLRDADVPTAEYRAFSNPDEATRYVLERYPDEGEEVPLVVKAGGLAAGKGVIVCSRRAEVLDAIDQIARQRVFGEAGREMVIEERLDGQEASVLAITDGRTIVTLPPAQDHKPAYDGDRGPNTGGMGAYCPAPLVDDEMLRWIESHVLVPTVHAMKRRGTPFQGVLYAGLMVTRQGPKGAGIQRPLWRSGMPAVADAAQDRLGRRAGSGRRTPPG